MKNKKLVTIAIIGIMIAVGCLSGCVGTCDKKPFVLCGEIEFMPTGTTWEEYGVLAMEEEYHTIKSADDEAFAVMKYAYENNCSISVTISYLDNCDKTIYDATLIECQETTK